ncbi:MAG: PEP-CTERM sorting domain-containing protein, partial [Tepidisphaeraceae bacterium]
MFEKTLARLLLAAALVAFSVTLRADTMIPMATVPVGDAGNAADTNTGSLYGAVAYNYNIGTCDVTLSQYAAFLTSVASSTDTYGLYNPSLGADSHVAGITQ